MMENEIIVLDGFLENPGDLSWGGFEALGALTVYDRTPVELAAARIGGANIVYTNKTLITRETLDACQSIQYIGMLSTGYNVVDVAAAGEKGIPVTNIPSYGSSAVSQFAIALLLEICHRIGHHSRAVEEGRWETNNDWCFWDYPLIELAGKTLGIIGLGRIGLLTGRIAKALGMCIIAFDECQTEPGREVADYVSLEKLLKTSDVISLHCPLFPSTEGIVNKKSIAVMKDGVILINTARGQLIVEQDLADALNSGKIYAAGLDVTSVEPIKNDNPLLKAKNCFITPHIAWAPRESRKRLMDIAVGNLRAFIDGNPVNVVNEY